MGTHTEFRFIPWGSNGTLELLKSIWKGDKFSFPFPNESMTRFLLKGPWSLYIPIPEATDPGVVPVRSALGRGCLAMPGSGVCSGEGSWAVRLGHGGMAALAVAPRVPWMGEEHSHD